MLHSIELVDGLEKGQELYCQSNRYTDVEYLMRMAPDVEVPRFPSLCYSQL